MKNIGVICMLLLLSCSFYACRESEADKRKKAIEMMTTQTLGLAYLEEFKLEDAEREFLKMIELAPEDKLGYANLGLVYLRMGKYKDAEEQLMKAIKIDPDDADIRLLLSTVYQMDGRREDAKEVLKKALEREPDHIKILYDLSELYSADKGEEAEKARLEYLQELVASAPNNIVPQLQLTEMLINSEEADQAIERLEIIHKQFPEFPKEAREHYSQTIELLQKQDTQKALVSFTIFHNYLKVSFPFQSGIVDLKGPGGSLIGFPLISYNRQLGEESSNDRSVLEIIKFKDITADQGMDEFGFDISQNNKLQKPTHAKTADYNGDGLTDFYIGRFDPSIESYRYQLLTSSPNGLKDITSELGLNHKGMETAASFADYDNDGFLDLYVNLENSSVLYKNADKGIFEDKTAESKIFGAQVNKALFFDLDQDGDLDLFEATVEGNRVFQNNGDGSFEEIGNKTGLSNDDIKNNSDAAFGDFDDDGDIDLVTVNSTGKNLIYTNMREGKFQLVEDSGLDGSLESSSVAVGDYNNDGFLDIFTGSMTGSKSQLYTNSGDGRFEASTNISSLLSGIEQQVIHDVEFLDFDNDGFQDLLIFGESSDTKGSGLQLYHNDGKGGFSNLSELLPKNSYQGYQLAVPDFDGDGDRDIFLTLSNGGVKLLRNDGGNMNHYVNVKLVGLRTGSAKNNYFGVGAKVEMRAGDLYQSMVVKDQNIYFGLGNRPKADIIRITWTNGVPQNILLPDSDQALIESQTLKGSCPFLYTWNGTAYEFVKDITWRSALGMPLGIMGGTTKYAFAAASDDYIKIDGDLLQEKDGYYSLQITSELWETIYMDQIELLAVDHPKELQIYVPEQFSPPPFPGLKIYQVEKKHAPLSARDESGNDLRSLILEQDDRYISNFEPGKYQGLTKMHDLILDPGEAGELENLHLFLRGWIFPTDASINVALSQSDELQLEFPVIQLIDQDGKWQTIESEMSFPMGKDKTVIVSLKDKYLSKDRRLRIRTNMEIYWDEIFFAEVPNNNLVTKHVLQVKNADLHYRGFSRTYRKGGRYGPHWFDYSQVNTDTRWRDLEGKYTRYGEVSPLLQSADNQYIISNAGDETSIKFDASDLPELKEGWTRDFLIHSVGWVKDGDFNTAEGNTVDPLPYHGIGSYPPARTDNYPQDSVLIEYHKRYNTRMVSREDFQNAIKPILSEK